MGSYFFPGNAGPVVQAIVLLPFLVLAAQGVRSCSSRIPAVDARGVALLGLPLVVPIGVMAALALGRFVFYPRWFAFLGPFFSALVALGIDDVAARARAGRRNGPAIVTPALVSAALVLSNVVVLGSYYFDSASRSYRWREAAALVKAQAGPTDFLLYVNDAALVSFTYYFHEPHPFLVLTPIEAQADAAPGRPGSTAEQALRLAARYPRVWVIATVPLTADMQQRLMSALRTAYRVVGKRDFTAAWVHLLEAKQATRP